MTENEAIKELKECVDLPFENNIRGETAEVAIKALEEIQQYRELDDKMQMETGITMKELYEKWNVMLGEYLEYQQLGTVEELRKAMEKQRAKKPKLSQLSTRRKKLYICPNCSNQCLSRKANERQDNRYCWDCGQAIDWSEEE